MTLLDYTLQIPLPAPITSGSGVQSYTDPTGEVWVAANGVNAGAWKRARDVLHAKYTKTATYTLPSGYTAMPWDSAIRDPYSLFSGVAATGFVAPIPGMYRFDYYVTVTTTAASQLLEIRCQRVSTYCGIAHVAPGAIGPVTAMISSQMFMNAGDNLLMTTNGNALVLSLGELWNGGSFDYMGTG